MFLYSYRNYILCHTHLFPVPESADTVYHSVVPSHHSPCPEASLMPLFLRFRHTSCLLPSHKSVPENLRNIHPVRTHRFHQSPRNWKNPVPPHSRSYLSASSFLPQYRLNISPDKYVRNNYYNFFRYSDTLFHWKNIHPDILPPFLQQAPYIPSLSQR